MSRPECSVTWIGFPNADGKFKMSLGTPRSTKQVRRDVTFILLWVVLYAGAVLIIPPYTPLIVPDSSSYIELSPLRTIFYPLFLRVCRIIGLDLVQTTWAQLGIFSMALAYLLLALRRAGLSQALLGVFVAILAGNILFSSFHRSILTESLYFSASAMAVAFWIDFFRTRQVRFLALAAAALGLMIGIRPVGLGLVTMHLLAVWLARPRAAPVWILLLAALLPLVAILGVEQMAYRLVHGNRQSISHYLTVGMAAMLIRPNMTFTGPHAAALNTLAARTVAKYEPVHRFLDQAPSLGVKVQWSARYYGGAAVVLDREIVEAAAAANTSVADLSFEFCKQVVLQNLAGYLRLVTVNQIGQWSIAAKNFPPTARRLGEYADANPPVAFGEPFSFEDLHPAPPWSGLVVYPAFLAAGAITLVLSLGFIGLLWRPDIINSEAGFYLGLATFFSAMCQVYTLSISVINTWTPRYLMAVFPQIELVFLFLLVALWKLKHR